MRNILNKGIMNINPNLTTALRESGGRLTRQRRLVLEILEESSGHLDAEAIFQEAKSRGENISLATIYRSLTFLKEAGLVEEHRLGEDHGHFEAIHSSPHYHFTCSRCGQVVEFRGAGITTAIQSLGRRKGFQINQVHLDLEGLCSACLQTLQPEND
jgi:Fe2+ or Zn2+ uptake regulation protein